MSKSIPRFLILLLVMLTTACCFCCALSENSETLQIGSKSEYVTQVKKQLYTLGYYTKGSGLTKTYTKDTAQRVAAFQKENGLPVTGILTPADAEVLFSTSAIHAPAETPQPFSTPSPVQAPEYPSRDAEGYLENDNEFVYESNSLWIYLSHDIQITITRQQDASVPLIWLETDIRLRGEKQMTSVLYGKYQYPDEIARQNNLILGFSDDFFGYRVSKKHTVGIIIRNGEIISDTTNKKTTNAYPNLDLLAVYADGSMKTFACNACTAQELIDMGVVQTYAFGPILIRNGELNREQLLSGHYSANEPRQALGMIEPGHYFLMTVLGRSKISSGTNLWRIAGVMKERGVTEAINLDGGNTVALVFRGKLINRQAGAKKVRTVTSLIGIK